MKMRKLFLLGVMLAFLGAPVLATADSITPTAVSASIPVGGTVTITKTVTVSAGPSTTKGDIFFLCDTTGSMGGAIAAVKTGAAAIMTGTAGLGDIAWGVGEYKDIFDSFAYRLNQSITTTQASVQAGINMWSASGGGDGPEAQFPALYKVATQTATEWRVGSEKVVVWFGDYEGHDPRDGVSKAQAIAALVAAGIQVEAISVGANRLDLGGQASSIASATGGHFYSGIDQSAIVAAIQAALEVAFSTYSTVGLDTSETPAGLGVSVVPVSYAGSWDRSAERSFEFSLTFTGLTPGTYEFDIFGTVDSGRVATESDRITVTATGVPEPGMLLLLGSGLIGLVGLRRKLS